MTIKNTFLLLALALILFANAVSGQHRVWNNFEKDDNTIHSLGNGKMLVYERGPEITTVYPGPFTSPALIQLLVEDQRDIVSASAREYGTAIWTHHLTHQNKPAGKLTDFVDAEIPVFSRMLQLDAPMTFRLVLNEDIIVLGIHPNLNNNGGTMLLMAESGAHIYQKYVYPKPLYHQLIWQGDISIRQAQDDEHTYLMEFAEGEAELFFVGGPDYPNLVIHSRLILDLGYKEMENRTRKWWNGFTSSRIDFSNRIAADLPMREHLLQTIDDVCVMIKTQQAAEGAVIAGYPYPLGYVRDQYGVAKALLYMGLHQEAKDILLFYWNIWRREGTLHCAQGIGVDGIFHVHENDEVESPGYLILQAFDMLRETRDTSFFKTIFPMMEWCWEVQKKHLAGGMLPFNGDETYVAGGNLPRSALNDGSAEATMLFIDGGQRFIDWVEMENQWGADRLEKDKAIIEESRNRFRDNFWADGMLITNQPARLNHIDPPDFRHGVCERGGATCLVFGGTGMGGIDWTARDLNNRYQCANCIQSGPMPPAEPTIFTLLSVGLISLYFESELIRVEELKPIVNKVFDEFRKTGILRSEIGGTGSPNYNKSVGYDYGLILHAMLKTNHPGAGEIFAKTLSLADPIGAWAEYYLDDLPFNTRCRPWESAINLEMLLRFATKY